MEFKGSRTEANLMAAFAGESQARNKYTFYAARAKKDGYEQIADIFMKTADNEKEHAEIWLKQLHGGDIPETTENLRDAAAGENYEWTEMYKEFERVATEEGFTQIAALFKMVGAIEKEHEKRFKTLRENLEKGIVFSREGETVWICRNCGHLHVGKEAPAMCPVCSHARAYFEIKCDNY
ncbi:MAG: rubrerythrin family protein [Clostridia bacterium]|nr:rubrerythrin family protein [Clostridia bacterium]MBQ2695007.1 rubrerythrin family protein [Clostridia bacterium]